MYCTALYGTALHYTVWHCTALYYTEIECNELSALHGPAVYCTAVQDYGVKLGAVLVAEMETQMLASCTLGLLATR